MRPSRIAAAGLLAALVTTLVPAVVTELAAGGARAAAGLRWLATVS